MKRIFIDHHWVSELDFNVEVSSADLFIALNVTCFGTLLLVRLVGAAKVQYCVGVVYELEAKLLTMMKTSILALLVAGASAFAPASMVR